MAFTVYRYIQLLVSRAFSDQDALPLLHKIRYLRLSRQVLSDFPMTEAI